MPLQVNSRREGRTALVKCSGRIVAGHESAELDRHVQQLRPEYNQFVLHLGDVQFIDSTGLGLLVRLLCSVRSVRGDLKLCAVPESIMSVLQLTKISSMFDTHADEETALGAFKQQTKLASGVSAASASVLCVEKSSDLLAYLREVLRRAGFEPLTTTNVSDALVLLKSARPQAAILGPGALTAGNSPIEAFRRAAAGIPLIEAGPEFATREPAEAATAILKDLQDVLQHSRKANA